MMKKKTIALTAAAALTCMGLFCGAFGVTYSYLIDKQSAKNTFTVGETIITVVEEIGKDYIPPKKLEPGISFKKAPYVSNDGNLPCYIRMSADFSNSKAKSFCIPLEIDGNWEQGSDGFYYYKELVYPGEKTTPLFERVQVKDDVDENDLVDFEIFVYGEAVQHTDHDSKHPDDEYLTVWQQYEGAGN